MADLIDVAWALAGVANGAMYPEAADPNLPSPVVGVTVRSGVGWPEKQELLDRLKAGGAMITAFAPPGTVRNETRYSREWLTLDRAAASYTLVADQGLTEATVTVGGVAPAPYRIQNIAILLNGLPYTVQTVTGQTAPQLALAIGAAVAADFPNSVTGPVITFDPAVKIGALRIGVTARVQRELRRQCRQFWVMTWASTPETRDQIVAAVDVALAALAWLPLADGTSGRLIYRGDILHDEAQLQGAFRRDLVYEVEYATTQTETAYEIVTTTATIRRFDDVIITTLQE